MAVSSYNLKYDIKKGISKTIDYYINNDKILGIDYRFDGQMDRVAASLIGGGKIGYLNYGARNSLTNYTQYLIGRYENNKLVRLLKFSINIVLRVVRKIMRIL